nr:MAG TPA: hypothetical protein [Caudoviricetes sp.]
MLISSSVKSHPKEDLSTRTSGSSPGSGILPHTVPTIKSSAVVSLSLRVFTSK